METEARAWAQRVAVRLLVLQATCGDDPPPVRQKFFADEIELALQDVSAHQRTEYLDALQERFPGPEQRAKEASAPEPTEPAPLEPEQLIDALVQQWAKFDPRSRALLLQRLRSLGAVPPTEGQVGLSPDMRAKLGLRPEDDLDETRLTKLCHELLEAMIVLDQLVWSIWKLLSPKSVFRRESDENLRSLIGRYLGGDREVATLQIQRLLQNARQLTVGLLSAIGPAGETYARHHLETFAPEKIRAQVESTSSGFLSGVEQKCWRKYIELANQLNGPAVEQQLRRAIVKYTEEMLGVQRAARNDR
jgi:hypothetical protein